MVIFRDESPRRKLDRLVDEVMTSISGSNVAVKVIPRKSCGVCTGGPLFVRFPLVQFPRVRIFRLMEAVRGRFRVWYEGCVIQVILLRNKWVGIAYELIPLRGRGHIPPGLANHSLEEKAEGLYF